MNARRVPFWVWILAAIVVLRAGDDLGEVLMPLLAFGFIAFLVLGQKGRSRHRATGAPRATPTVQPPPDDGPMPTIDVPPYPGAGPEPADPWSSGATPRTVGGPPSAGGTSSLGSDPAVSLVRLQVAQVGRDLEQALATADGQRVDQALRRVTTTVDQAESTLDGSRAAGASRVRAALAGLRAAAQEALQKGHGPDRAALVGRIVSTCRSVGQTGAL